jgi:molybdopterin molybdotransferase
VLTVDEYRERLLASVSRLAPLQLPLPQAHGCVLAVDVMAPWPLPSFDNSSMDGYAVLAADVSDATAATPVELRVLGDVPAGSRAVEPVVPGTAIRIMTGAPLPEGADAVVPVESTDGGMVTVQITASVPAGASIRRAGEDVTSGEVVMKAGTLIGARQVALLAAVGAGHVLAHPRPRVAVISTGSELVDPGQPMKFGQVADSNSHLLVTACREVGADAYRVGPIADDEDAFLAAVEDQIHRCDLIITSGGVSMGAYDTVKTVFSRLGTVEFLKVAMSPGMPQGFGFVGEEEVPVITLPGNPVSSYISFENFVRPAIQRMRGVAQEQHPTVEATSGSDISSPLGKRQFVRAQFLADGVVSPVGTGQGSHVLGGLAAAEALIVIAEDVERVAAGDSVEIIDLR